jgi:hypothetical protein
LGGELPILLPERHGGAQLGGERRDMANTADWHARLETGAKRAGSAGLRAATRAVAFGRQHWVRRHRSEERAHIRWGAAALLVLVGVISALVVPQGADAGTEPRFDSASVSAAVDPPVVSPVPTATGPVAAPAVQPVNVPLPLKPTVPVGKGMWLHIMSRAQGGDPQAIVQHALSHGLTHLYVRLGSSRSGFYGQGDLDKILPVAHAARLKIIGWDFPYLDNVPADADRAAAEIAYRTPDGHGIDAFSADIETPAEGTNLTTVGVDAYGRWVRIHAGPTFPLIAAVPRPNGMRWYPYAEATASFDAIAPMVYWINRDPVSDVVGAIRDLAPLGKPILPVGQAYDPAVDGNKQWGPPSAADLHRFMQAAGDLGVASYSFWSWDTAGAEQWAAIGESAVLDIRALTPGPEYPKQVANLQRMLKGLGLQVGVDGTFGPDTLAGLRALQQQLGVPVTGQLDEATLKALKHPR